MRNFADAVKKVSAPALCAAAMLAMAGCSTETYVHPDTRTYAELTGRHPDASGLKEEFVTLRNKHGAARISLIGANVVSYVPAGGEEVLFSVKKPDLRSDSFQHCGIPVVWPWFNMNGEAGSAAHSFVRQLKWSVVSKEETANMSRIVLEVASSDETRRIWPYDFRLRYTVTLDDQLRVSLVTENTDRVPFDITEGFHTYLRVSDVDKVVLRGLDGCRNDRIASWIYDPVFKGDLRFHAGEGRVFTPGKGEYVLFDEGAGRAICVAARGHRKLILWSIPESSCIGSFTGDDWKHFACIEPATISREAALRIVPGKRHELRMSIKAVPLGKSTSKPLISFKGPVDGKYASERFVLDKEPGKNAYYSLRFNAKSDANGYWWVDFYDKDGKMLPDVNSQLARSDDFVPYDVIVPASPEAVEAVLKFPVKGTVTVRDVKMCRAGLDEAVEWCDRTYKAGPRIDYVVAPDCWARLPRSRKALTGPSRRFDVVLLGDSIMNDTYCGLIGVQMQRAFPEIDLRIHPSFRGSTGCGYYHEPANFDEYVAKFKPDLVLIGGISNAQKKFGDIEANMVETIRRCQAIGAEVVVCTPAKSLEFRASPESAPIPAGFFDEATAPGYRQVEFERRAAAKTGAQLWDVTTATYETVARSGKPIGWFNRDTHHNNDRGKQLIGQLFGEYFRAAFKPVPKTTGVGR